LVLRGWEQLDPNGLSGAGHKRRRHGTNDIGKATNGSSGEAEKISKKEAQLETASADNAIAQRKEDNGSGNSGAGGSSDDSSNGGASSEGGTRRLAEAGRRGSDLV
jgi:hypothetical protein